MKTIIRIGIVCLVLIVNQAVADQVIYVQVSSFDPELSDFDVDVKGNKWIEVEEEGALFGVGYGAPGDNNRDVDGPHLVIKLPVPVKAGEATANGKTWIAWARMMHPEALFTGNQFNSTFFRMSPDAKKLYFRRMY